ncbi:MAG TPA: hypothetical protein K8W21_03090 [Enorma massiliensis]|nr:hypothetical protein [Enorma massiliensis]HJG61954.1 hypothetical protein [Enorma massiliensis]
MLADASSRSLGAFRWKENLEGLTVRAVPAAMPDELGFIDGALVCG